MGRTNPPFRDVLRVLEDRWKPFRRALRYEDQKRFDQLLTHARNHADAAGNLNHQSPVIPVLVAITLAQERRLDELEAHLEDAASAAGDHSTGLDSR
ncbi:MAG: hypothetical protein V5A27_13125 [Halapricum sp.]